MKQNLKLSTRKRIVIDKGKRSKTLNEVMSLEA